MKFLHNTTSVNLKVVGKDSRKINRISCENLFIFEIKIN